MTPAHGRTHVVAAVKPNETLSREENEVSPTK